MLIKQFCQQSSTIFQQLVNNNYCFMSKQKVVLFPGNGIGPEISQAVVDIFAALKVPIEWEHHEIYTKGQTAEGDLISADSIARVRELRYGLKGPF